MLKRWRIHYVLVFRNKYNLEILIDNLLMSSSAQQETIVTYRF